VPKKLDSILKFLLFKNLREKKGKRSMEEKSALSVWWSNLGKWQALAVFMTLAVFFITRHITGDNNIAAFAAVVPAPFVAFAAPFVAFAAVFVVAAVVAAFAAATAARAACPGLKIRNPGCVNKSYPGFWKDFRRVFSFSS